MKPIDITKAKGEFFRILGQTPLSQIGVMTIAPGRDSGPEEIHKGDQIVYILEGEADMAVGSETHRLTPGMIATVPAKERHHIVNTGQGDLFFLTIYTPPAY